MTLIPRKHYVTEPAMEILMNSELLTKADCKNLDGIIFELCRADGKMFKTDCYRMFFSTDDYDYLFRQDEQPLVDELNKLFNANVQLTD